MFGITESGDAGLDFSWEGNLQLINVVISKHVWKGNLSFLDKVLEHKDCIILHVTCTGWGATAFEPGVPSMSKIHDGVLYLIENGFPVSQMVLRVDPIFPNNKGIARVIKVLDLFRDTGISRVRYSIVDMYPHVIKRFDKKFGKAPFRTFQASREAIMSVYNALHEYGYYDFESCGEDLDDCIGCISQIDLELFGLDYKPTLIENTRKYCKCLPAKIELLKGRQQCRSQCIYCYWRKDYGEDDV